MKRLYRFECKRIPLKKRENERRTKTRMVNGGGERQKSTLEIVNYQLCQDQTPIICSIIPFGEEEKQLFNESVPPTTKT